MRVLPSDARLTWSLPRASLMTCSTGAPSMHSWSRRAKPEAGPIARMYDDRHTPFTNNRCLTDRARAIGHNVTKLSHKRRAKCGRVEV